MVMAASWENKKVNGWKQDNCWLYSKPYLAKANDDQMQTILCWVNIKPPEMVKYKHNALSQK